MSRLKRVLPTGAMAALVAAGALAAPAQATKVVAACVIGGEAKVLDKDDPNLGMRLVGGKGMFVYQAVVVVCVGASKGVPDAQVMLATADGSYENLVCGTGKAWGTLTSVSGPTKYVNILRGKKYAIHFAGAWPAASTGIVFWHRSKAPETLFDLKDELETITKPNGSFEKPKVSTNWHPAGVMRMAEPTQKDLGHFDPGANSCTKAVSFIGTVLMFSD